MTYQVNLKHTNEEMLLGLINHDNNPDNIPHQDLWPKVSAVDIENVVEGSRYIAPEHPWVVGVDGKAIDMVVKKELPFESKTCKVVIRGDDSTRIYVDEVGYQGNRNKEHKATINIPVEPGMRTVAIWVVNTELDGGLSFAIYDDEKLIAVSDESWGYVTPIENQIVKERYFKKGWHVIQPEDVLYIRPPVAIDVGDYERNGTIDNADIPVEPGVGNFAHERWNQAEVYPGTPSSYERVHPDAKYLTINAWMRPPKDSELCFVRSVNCLTGNLRIEVVADDYATVFVDGVEKNHTFNHVKSSLDVSVTPGIHKIAVVVKEGPGGSPVQANWAIYDDGNVVAVSDTTWKAKCDQEADFTAKKVKVVNTIPSGYRMDFEWLDNGVEAIETVSTIYNPDGSKVETRLVDLQDTDWMWTAEFVNLTPPLNTITTVVTTDDEYEVKEVPVSYNRMSVDKLFSLCGLSVREINLDVAQDGSIVLNQRVLDEMNRRYGVNFQVADFELTYDEKGYKLAASPNSVAFNDETAFTVIRSLTTRIPNRTLNGFLSDKVETD
tara:strand:+ start:1360 stop:3012 length:1653 start_codon:yes stop_codon:yes gene_type:complete